MVAGMAAAAKNNILLMAWHMLSMAKIMKRKHGMKIKLKRKAFYVSAMKSEKIIMAIAWQGRKAEGDF